MILSEHQKTSGYFNSYDGTRLYYESHGHGRPLILCYGLACSMNHWIHQIQPFAQNYRVILWDYRGHHFSNTSTEVNNLSISGFADDLLCLINHLKLEQASLWGHSFGAPVILNFASRFKEQTANLVLINGFAENPFKDFMGFPLASQLARYADLAVDELPSSFRYLWETLVNNPLALRISALAGGFNLSLAHLKDLEVYAKGVASVSPQVFLKLFRSMTELMGTDYLDRISCPTLIISGEKDLVTPHSFQQILHDKISGSRLERVPEGSHCTQLDLPDLTNELIKAFLTEVKFAHD